MKKASIRKAALCAAAMLTAPAASAQQIGQYVGEVRSMAFGFCPQGWTVAGGQLLPISNNSALFSLYGTTFGGDGRTTFGVPNLVSRAPVHNGTGPGLTPRALGNQFGVESVSQVPQHTHNLNATNDNATQNAIAGGMFATATLNNGTVVNGYSTSAPTVQMDVNSIALNSGVTSVPNTMPSQAMLYCVALQGLYPSFN